MRVFFDARFIRPRRTGVGRTTELLLRALRNNHPKTRFITLYHDPLDPSLELEEMIRTNYPFDSHPGGDWFRNTGMVKLIRQRDADVFHSPAFYSIQRRLRVPQVVTIHDLAVFDTPETFPRRFVLYFRWLIRSSCRHATIILVASRFNKERLESRFPESSGKVRVVPFGVDRIFQPDTNEMDLQLREDLVLPDGFILDVSTVETRKNLMNLLDGYEIYRRRSSRPLPLIIAGKDGMGAESIKKRARHGALDYSVRFTGYLATEEIAALYRLATVTVFPSVYEGLGLPVLESMASGCPVITSTVSALPEVAGDSAMLIDPMSPVEIADALVAMTQDDDRRRDYIRKGLKHAAQFTWKNTASLTVRAYEEAIDLFHRKGKRKS